MKRAIVTGSTGEDGSYLIEFPLAKGCRGPRSMRVYKKPLLVISPIGKWPRWLPILRPDRQDKVLEAGNGASEECIRHRNL